MTLSFFVFSSQITLPCPAVRFDPAKDIAAQMSALSAGQRPNGHCLLVVMDAAAPNKTLLQELVASRTKVQTFLQLVVGKVDRFDVDANSWSTYVNLYRHGDGTRADYVCAGEAEKIKLHFRNGRIVLNKEEAKEMRLCGDMIKNRQISVAYNNIGFEFQVDANQIDSSTFEGVLLHTYAVRNSLKINFVQFHNDWSVYNYTTNEWKGIPRMVSLPICIL